GRPAATVPVAEDDGAERRPDELEDVGHLAAEVLAGAAEGDGLPPRLHAPRLGVADEAVEDGPVLRLHLDPRPERLRLLPLQHLGHDVPRAGLDDFGYGLGVHRERCGAGGTRPQIRGARFEAALPEPRVTGRPAPCIWRSRMR